MDPPVFGRGPKGELWRFEKSFPLLLDACKEILSDRPLFVLLTAYAIQESSLLLYNLLSDWMKSRGGTTTVGELVLQDTAAQRPLSTAIYVRLTIGKDSTPANVLHGRERHVWMTHKLANDLRKSLKTLADEIDVATLGLHKGTETHVDANQWLLVLSTPSHHCCPSAADLSEGVTRL